MSDEIEIEEVTQNLETTHIDEPSTTKAAPQAAAAEEEVHKTKLSGHVGFSSIFDQIYRKNNRRGFEFNLLVAGASGSGKSTFVNTLFAASLVDSKAGSIAERTHKTVEIETITHLIEEGPAKLKLTVIDTPGFGDFVNNENAWEPIVNYINEQYAKYQQEESAVNRPRYIRDTRVHLVVYFIQPTGHGLKPLDVEAMKAISQVANLIPVIAKSDSLTLDERNAFKKRIQEELEQNKINVYPASSDLEYDDVEAANNEKNQALIPFAIVASTTVHDHDGKKVRGRRTPWGLIVVEDESHCEFANFRDFVIGTNLQDLIEVTRLSHYESFRSSAPESTKKSKKDKEPKEGKEKKRK